MPDTIRIGRRAGLDVITLASPRNRNALSRRLMQEFRDAIAVSAAGDSRGLLIDHDGPAFCAGIDLKEQGGSDVAAPSPSVLLGDLFTALWAYPKPVVAAVDGACRGGGMGLLGCSDIVFATERSTFAYSEPRVGVAAALVLAVTTAQLSSRRLLPYLLRSNVFTAAEAERAGVVTDVIGTDGEDPVAECLADIGRGAPSALVVTKRLARQADPAGIAARVQEMVGVSRELFATDDAAEGRKAFADRRAPQWVEQ